LTGWYNLDSGNKWKKYIEEGNAGREGESNVNVLATRKKASR